MKKIFSLSFLLLTTLSFFSCSNMFVSEKGGSISIYLNSNQARLSGSGSYEESDAEEYEILIKGKTEISKRFSVQELKENAFFEGLIPGEYSITVNAYGKLLGNRTDFVQTTEEKNEIIAFGSTNVLVLSGATAFAKVYLSPRKETSFEINGLSIQDIEYKFNADYFIAGSNNFLGNMITASVTYNDGTVLDFKSFGSMKGFNINLDNLSDGSKLFVGNVPVEIVYNNFKGNEIKKELVIPVKYRPDFRLEIEGNKSIAKYTGVESYQLKGISGGNEILVYGTNEPVQEEFTLDFGVQENWTNAPAYKVYDEIDSGKEKTKELKLGMYSSEKLDSKYIITGKTKLIVDERYAVPDENNYEYSQEMTVNVVDYSFGIKTVDIDGNETSTSVSGALAKGATYNLTIYNSEDSRLNSGSDRYGYGTEVNWESTGPITKITDYSNSSSFRFLVNEDSTELEDGSGINVTFKLTTEIFDVDGNPRTVSVTKTKTLLISENNLYSFKILPQEGAIFEAKFNESGNVQLDLEKFEISVMDSNNEMLDINEEYISYSVPTYSSEGKKYPYIGKVPVTWKYNLNDQQLSVSVEVTFVHTLEKANELKVFYSEDGINYSEISEPLTVNEYSRIYLKAAADNSNWTKYVYYNTSNRMILLDPENYQWEENNRTYQGEFLEIETVYLNEKIIKCSYTPSIDYYLFEIQPYLVFGTDIAQTKVISVIITE